MQLTHEEHETLRAVISKGKAAARIIRRAHILLLTDENRPEEKIKDEVITSQLQVHLNIVFSDCKAYTKQDMQAAIHCKKRPTPPLLVNIIVVLF